MNTDAINQTLDNAKLAQDKGDKELADSIVNSWYYDRLSSGDIGIQNMAVNNPAIQRLPIPMLAYNPRAYPEPIDNMNPYKPKLQQVQQTQPIQTQTDSTDSTDEQESYCPCQNSDGSQESYVTQKIVMDEPHMELPDYHHSKQSQIPSKSETIHNGFYRPQRQERFPLNYRMDPNGNGSRDSLIRERYELDLDITWKRVLFAIIYLFALIGLWTCFGWVINGINKLKNNSSSQSSNEA